MHRIRSSASPRKTRALVISGQSGCGKSSILYHLKHHKTMKRYYPGYSVFYFEKVTLPNGKKLLIFDTGGCNRRQIIVFCQKSEGLVFVVDGSNPDSFRAAANHLRNLCCSDESNMPLLVLVTKKDLLSWVGLAVVRVALELHSITDRLWHIHACSGVTGEGLMPAFEELTRMMKYFVKN